MHTENIVLGIIKKPKSLDKKPKMFTLTPQQIITNRTALLGTTGCGKSNAIGVVLEGLLKANYPFTLIDTHGEHGLGLKSKFEVIVASAGDEGDIINMPLHSAVNLAKTVVDGDLSLIVDLNAYKTREKQLFVTEFVNALFQAVSEYWKNGNPKPRLLAIEETHIFAPQKYKQMSDAISNCKDAIETVASQGRKRGLGMLVASQRSAKFNKDVLAMCDLYVLMWASWPDDVSRGHEFLGKEKGREMYGLPSIMDLDPGDAIITGKKQLISSPHLIRFNYRETPYEGVTPQTLVPVTPKFKESIQFLKDLLSKNSPSIPPKNKDVGPSTSKTSRVSDNTLVNENIRLKTEIDALRSQASSQVSREQYVEKKEYLKLRNELEDLQQAFDESLNVNSVDIDEFGIFHSSCRWLCKILNQSLPRTDALIIKHLSGRSMVSAGDLSRFYGLNEASARLHLKELYEKKILKRSIHRPYKYSLIV